MSNLHKARVNWSSESVTFRIRRWSLSSMWHSSTFNHITNSWVCGGVYYLNCRVIASMSFQFGSADIIQFSFVDIINSHHWCRQWLGAKQAPSHYLNQWWLKSLKHWCVARDQCVNTSDPESRTFWENYFNTMTADALALPNFHPHYKFMSLWGRAPLRLHSYYGQVMHSIKMGNKCIPIIWVAQLYNHFSTAKISIICYP